MKRYGLYGSTSRDFLTYGGQILVHGDHAELAFLFPHGVTVRELPADIPADQCLPIRFHPDLQSVRWPLDRRQFTHR